MSLSQRVGAGHTAPLSTVQLDAYLERLYNGHVPPTTPPTTQGDLLPNRVSLRTRQRDYFRRASDTLAPTGMYPGPAMDRFRDIPPSLVLAVFEGDVAQVEPGGAGPLPLGHPVMRELVECINRGFVTPTILALAVGDLSSVVTIAGEEGEEDEQHVVTAEDDDPMDPSYSATTNSSAPQSKRLYDGGLVVGILDYRKSCSFATVSTTAPGTTGMNHAQGLLSSMAAQGVAPEMHKVFLRPGYASLAPFMPAEAEAQILLRLYPEIVTDPDPKAWQAMEWSMYDRDKVAVHCAPMLTDYPLVSVGSSTSSNGNPLLSTTKANTPGPQPNIDPMLPLQKIKQLSAMDEWRSRKAAGAAEAFLGIDQRRNLARTRSSLPTTVMNNPSQRVWRTLRFERDHQRHKLYYSLNIMCTGPPSGGGGFEVVLRRGAMPDTAQGPHGFTQRFHLPSLPAVEQYIVHLKQLFGLEDGQRRLTVDVANPAVLSGNVGSAVGNGGAPILSKPPLRHSPI